MPILRKSALHTDVMAKWYKNITFMLSKLSLYTHVMGKLDQNVTLDANTKEIITLDLDLNLLNFIVQ